ncbi:MAG: cupin domain-containing protein [Sphingobacteriaceae bacterium]|nr:cupin domain-containing protein [Sphingobacteriaceae bacterium]
MNAQHYIKTLALLPHPEGGYYKETYRSNESIELQQGKRNYSTAIYFLLEEGNFSAFHKIKSDELWHFYAGDILEVIEITKEGKLKITELGPNNFQYCVPAGNWFGSRVKKGGAFSLVGCTVAPGFDFADFEMAERTKLLIQFPELKEIINALTRN